MGVAKNRKKNRFMNRKVIHLDIPVVLFENNSTLFNIVITRYILQGENTISIPYIFTRQRNTTIIATWNWAKISVWMAELLYPSAILPKLPTLPHKMEFLSASIPRSFSIRVGILWGQINVTKLAIAYSNDHVWFGGRMNGGGRGGKRR